MRMSGNAKGKGVRVEMPCRVMRLQAKLQAAAGRAPELRVWNLSFGDGDSWKVLEQRRGAAGTVLREPDLREHRSARRLEMRLRGWCAPILY